MPPPPSRTIRKRDPRVPPTGTPSYPLPRAEQVQQRARDIYKGLSPNKGGTNKPGETTQRRETGKQKLYMYPIITARKQKRIVLTRVQSVAKEKHNDRLGGRGGMSKSGVVREEATASKHAGTVDGVRQG